MLDALSVGIIVPALPQLVRELSCSSQDPAIWVSILAAAWGGAQFLAAPLMGALADRYGRRPVLIIALAGLAADAAFMALAPSVGWLLLGRLLSGALAASIIACNAYVLDVSPEAEKAHQLGLLSSAWSLGFIVGPALGGGLADLHPRLPFLVCSASAAAAFVYAVCRLEESLPPRLRPQQLDWRRTIPFIGLGELFRSARLRRPMVVLTLSLLADLVLPTFFALYAMQRYGWNGFGTGLGLTGLAIARICVLAFGLRALDRKLGEIGTLVFGLLCISAALLVFGLAPTSPWFCLGLPIYALGVVAAPSLAASLSKRVEPAGQGRLQGASTALQGIVSAAAPLPLGAAYTLTAQADGALAAGGGAMVLGAAFSIAAAIAAATLPTANAPTPLDHT